MPKKKLSAGKIGCFAVILVFLVLAVGAYRLFTAHKSLPESFVLTISLSGDISEAASTGFSFPFEPASRELSLQDMIFLLEKAGKDKRVRSILLELNGVQAGSVKIQALQQAIERTRKTKKPVHAFLRNAGDQDVWLASACDTVIAERGNFLLLDGLKAELLFFTGTLEKLGVTFQSAQWSKWKSGVEPYTRLSASPAFREQITTQLDRVYAAYTGSVTSKRNISPEIYEEVINNKTVLSAEMAKELKIVDAISSRWEYEEQLRKSFDTGASFRQDGDVLVSGARYKSAVSSTGSPETKERIALITASGPIVRSAGSMIAEGGQGFDEGMLKNSVKAALDDESVKAIVLRIDSPGGDALASLNMLQILDSAKTKKPIVASMSSVAASGGYMIALAADSIFAEPLTMTGSIGVYALKPEISKLQEKIGLQREVLSRGKNADAFTLFKPLDRAGMAKFMETTGWIYDDFLAQVARSRKMTKQEVEAVAGGRDWLGEAAVEKGLVDRIGGLRDALRAAQSLAGIDSTVVPGIKLYPEPPSLMEYFLGGGAGISARLFKRNFPLGNLPDRTLQTLELLMQFEQPPGGMYRMAMQPYELRVE